MRTTLLVCNVPSEICGRLRFVCMRMKVMLREVLPEEYGCTPAQILSGRAAPADSAGIGEGMLIMCGFSSVQMNQLLQQARQVPLKAVLTPTNKDWPIDQLYQELCREREAMKQAAPVHREKEEKE